MSGPHFANVVQMVGMVGGNADRVNGFYIPTSARLFSFPIYTKYDERSNCMTSTKLCLFYQCRRYYWVVRDSTDTVIAKVKYPPLSQAALSLPEHIPDTLSWELLSTGFFGHFKKKPGACVRTCNDNTILQQMSSFIGPGSRYIDSVSESIRFIDSTVQDMEAILVADVFSDSNTPTDDNHDHLINIDIEEMSMDQIIELYSQEIFNGYGDLVSYERNATSQRGHIPFTALQEKLEEKVSSSLLSALETEKVLCQLTDDAPEEFIDPISLMLMQQPMRVPTSPYVMDRKTLVAHLAINPTDPFSRRPLTMEMIYPDVALKIRIDEWLLTQGVMFS